MNVFRDIGQFWAATWKSNKLLFVAEAVGTIFSLSAATMLAVTSEVYLFQIFIAYILCNVLFIYSSYVREHAWLLVMSMGFFVLNIIGLINTY